MSEAETPVDAPARRPRWPWVVPVAALVFIVSATAILTVRAKLKERRRQKAIAAINALGSIQTTTPAGQTYSGIFFALQREFVSGLTSGAVKG